MKKTPNRIITIGGSAGGLEAARQILSTINADLPVSVFLVLHSGNMPTPAIKSKISDAGPFPADFAKDGETIKSGQVYLPPSDHHILVQDNKVRVTHGPRVNRSRPAIDLLFRSAAVAFGAKTIGVILSGMLYDGTAGLRAVGECGGITIVQDPANAAYPELPENVISQMDPEHVEPAAAIGILLNRLTESPVDNSTDIPADIALENRMDLNEDDDILKMDQLGIRVPFSCPDCSGQLWEIDGNGNGTTRFRCHTGHSMDSKSLLKGQDEEIEKILWVALRTLEEKVQVQNKIANSGKESGKKVISESFRERAGETRSHAKRLRKLLMEIYRE